MVLLETLVHPRVIGGYAAYACALACLMRVETWLSIVARASAPNAWIVEHILVPIARIMALLLFIGVSYPILLGIEQGPPLRALLQASDRTVVNMVNILFLMGLILPLTPFLRCIPGMLILLQIIAAEWLLLLWIGKSMGLSPVNPWPGMSVLITMLLASWIGHLAERWGQHVLWGSAMEVGPWWRYTVAGTLRLIMQLPAVLIYTRVIGNRLVLS